MHFIIPDRPPQHMPGEPWTAGELLEDLIWQEYADQPYLHLLEVWLCQLEEAVCSRRARRRLRRELRRRTERFAWVGPSFYARRIEDLGNEALCRGDR